MRAEPRRAQAGTGGGHPGSTHRNRVFRCAAHERCASSARLVCCLLGLWVCGADIVAQAPARTARLACHLSPSLALPPRLPAASYNPTVALLESSSLAQIAMLSFGMRLRFTSHLLVSASWHGAVPVLRYVAIGLPGRASRPRWLPSHGPAPLLPTDEFQLHHHAQLRRHAQLRHHAPHPPFRRSILSPGVGLPLCGLSSRQRPSVCRGLPLPPRWVLARCPSSQPPCAAMHAVAMGRNGLHQTRSCSCRTTAGKAALLTRPPRPFASSLAGGACTALMLS